LKDDQHMMLYPAIDLKGGRCVRLVEGRMDDATIFNEDPAEQAVRFQTAGFHWIHVVDLDGAIEGTPRNAGAIAGILNRAVIPVQVGGGVRSMSAVSYWIDAGVSRVVIGTAALKDPAFVREAARTYPERIAVAIDVRDGKVAVEGWVEQSEVMATDLAARFADAGVAAVIVTDIKRDGLKTGINVDLTGQLADAVAIPVIASGGAKSVSDINALKARAGRHPIHGCILGRALYDGDIDPAEALTVAAS
jgi:phosphoribosylformimino-5-aminoimidazole carboxamide ribotide isomerase